MDTAQWTQQIGQVSNNGNGNNSITKPLEEITSTKKARTDQNHQALNCPRCTSSNTKFCYYNNYSLTQPRYFCKACKRYWTQGGTLRNIPIGGYSRKHINKKSSSSKINLDDHMINPVHFFPISYQNDHVDEQRPMIDCRVLNTIYATGLQFHEFNKPTSGFCVDHQGDFHGVVEGNGNGKSLFPFGDVKQISSTNVQVDYNIGEENPIGYWNNGMFGGVQQF